MRTIPSFIARPLFHILYLFYRRKAPIPPIRRVVRPFPVDIQSAYDRVLVAALVQGPDSPIDYRLPYPKADFLNYICDWRGYVAHGT